MNASMRASRISARRSMRVGVPYSLNMYPGTQHGFHNDSSAARYNEPAAKLAWRRTIDFFDTYLKT